MEPVSAEASVKRKKGRRKILGPFFLFILLMGFDLKHDDPKVGENMFEDIRDWYGMGYGYQPVTEWDIVHILWDTDIILM